MHTDCIYLVPSTSSFHIVYFCGLYVPVKMQICVFLFSTCNICKKQTNKKNIRRGLVLLNYDDNVSIYNFPRYGKHKIAHFCWFEPSNTMRAVLCTLMFCTYGIHRDVGHIVVFLPQPAV